MRSSRAASLERTRALMTANRRLSSQWLRLQRANAFKNEGAREPSPTT